MERHPNDITAGSPDQLLDRLWQGTRIAQYRLVRELGRGVAGVVYHAEDTSLERSVAIKLFPLGPTEIAQKEEYTRFLNEARASAGLDHENIVRIYEIGQDDQWFFIAMELVAGSDLESMIAAAGPIDPRRACVIGAEVAQALAYAHQMGVVHRDIKPGNLILSRTGRCKITDFGLARRLDSIDDASDLAHAAGTPHYVAPEVACGKPATPASDVYSLGATLWHLLTGQPLFQGPHTRAIVMKHIREAVPDLTKIRPDVDKGLALVLHRALAKRPQERWAADELSRVLWSLTIPASASTLVLPADRPFEMPLNHVRRLRRETVMPVLAAAFALLIAVAAIYGAAVSWTHPGWTEQPLLAEFERSRQTADPDITSVDLTTAAPAVQQLKARAIDAAPPGVTPVHAGELDHLQEIAMEHGRHTYMVYGKVASARTSSTGQAFRIVFDTYPSTFYAVAFPALYPGLEQTFGGTHGSGLEGRTIGIVGRITSYNNCPQIKIDSLQQIVLLDTNTESTPFESNLTRLDTP